MYIVVVNIRWSGGGEQSHCKVSLSGTVSGIAKRNTSDPKVQTCTNSEPNTTQLSIQLDDKKRPESMHAYMCMYIQYRGLLTF